MAEEPQAPRDQTAPVGGAPPKPEESAKSASQDEKPTAATADGKVRATTAENDPVRELLDRMERMSPMLSGEDARLARTMQSLSQQGSDPDRREQIGFRHELAYVLQDLEKSAIGKIDINPALRNELTRLAGGAPGLENERMQALMGVTGAINDKVLVREIREAGLNIGRQADQNAPDGISRIDVLENRVRLAQRPPEAEASPGANDRAKPTQAPEAGEQRATGGQTTAAERPDVNGATANGGTPQTVIQADQMTYKRSVLDTILTGMRPREQGTGAPWDPPPTPMAERLSNFERKMTENRDERTFEGAMKTGRAAIDAIQAFSNGEGATVMSRINAAAASQPGGISSVLSEMRDGGRFADLRKQFSNALETNLGLASAYDKAAGALNRYATDRSTVQDIVGRRPDGTAITRRFEEMDAELGTAAAKTPSRTEGHSMMDDLAQRAAELLYRAVDAVKAAFSRSPSTDAASRPGPSPSMSA